MNTHILCNFQALGAWGTAGNIVITSILTVVLYLFIINLIKNAKNNHLELSKDHTSRAKLIILALGSKKNIVSISNSATRLRLKVKDASAVDKKALQQAGAIEVLVTKDGTFQIIVGTVSPKLTKQIQKLI